ncbi:GSCFA domain-containing protein [Gramella lutea]|uniref:GSCFA domain-containing protein n=1 Tax=Christiangramia lutea TaxID=1607951 RepID=A0A9X1V089_9FLAO|nr:GSCFA domain-containing protein [Christiangramia lutea]MCH4821897.1 GSCFA domain-containing protein [Christiangramia lutea]
MDFRTKVPIQDGAHKLEHAGGVFLIGSCFVENIGAKLEWFKFKNLQNPTGIIFHPSPIRRFFQRLSNEEKFREEDVFEFNGGWQSLEAHSDMRRDNHEECLSDLNSALKQSREYIQNTSHVIISLGTAWGYVYEGKDNIAANCHKVPQKKFTKELSSITEIINDLEVIDHSVSQLNKNASIIFTISPVRHLKDGFTENQLSKSHLIAALHQFIESSRSSYYFPSYEIMMDELRDYRFYAGDMLHPSKLAVDYIWELFSNNWLSKSSISLNSEIDKIQRSLAHSPRAENSTKHRKFLTNLQGKIEEIQKKHPEITFS